MSDFQRILNMYGELKSLRDEVKPLHDDIGRVVGIQTDADRPYNKGNGNKAVRRDQFVDDPTAAISVNQAGEYLVGVMWGTGDGVLQLHPSQYVKDRVDEEIVKDYYAYATNRLLWHLNHPQTGYSGALLPYAYDQVAFGTSGIGIFPNKEFIEGRAENALIARGYGVDNIAIDVGKSGMVDYVFATYHWRVSRIVGEFGTENLPKRIRECYEKGNLNEKFTIVFGMFPRDDFNPRKKGKKGTKYRGVWFMGDAEANRKDEGGFFFEEDFAEKPINIRRAIRIRGEVWGRSSGTMLISSINSVNYMVSTAIEIIEKMADPSLGVFSNTLFGDDAIDTSPSGLTVFNQTAAGNGNPIFPLYDVGDPRGLIEFLIPYLNEKITTAFKIDALLDFNSQKDMTAAETLKRDLIRSQSLAGLLTQQKNEGLVPDVTRAISILYNLGELGVNPRLHVDIANQMREGGRSDRVIPESVLDAMDNGRQWFDIQWNNQLDRMIRTEKAQNLVQVINAVSAVMAIYPQIVMAINWYKLVREFNDNLDSNNGVMLSEKEFRAAIEQQAQAQQAMMGLQAQAMAAQSEKDASQAFKNTRDAQNVGR